MNLIESLSFKQRYVKAGTNYEICIVSLMVIRWSSVCMTCFFPGLCSKVKRSVPRGNSKTFRSNIKKELRYIDSINTFWFSYCQASSVQTQMSKRGHRFGDMRITTGSKLPTSTAHKYILQNYV